MKEKLRAYTPYEMDRIAVFTYSLEILHYLTSVRMKMDEDGQERVIIYQDKDGHNVQFDVDSVWHGASDLVLDLENSMKREGLEKEVGDVIRIARQSWEARGE